MRTPNRQPAEASPMLCHVKRAFLFYALSTLVLAIQFGLYISGNSLLSIMDAGGWVFFAASCLSHASQIALVPFLLMVVFALCRLPRVGWWMQIATVSALCVLNYVNMQVYALYRFHINGFMLSMFFGEGGGEVFTFGWAFYAKAIAMFALLAAMVVGAAWGARWIFNRWHKAFAWPIAILFVAATVFAHVYHIYAAFYQKPSVVKSAQLLPYYFPTTAYGLMVSRGFEPPVSTRGLEFAEASGDIRYPIAPLRCAPPDSLPNVVLILVDSWNKRAADPATMPRVNEFAAREASTFTNHLSSSNGTRSSVFGIFFGLPCYYWEAFDVSGVQPVMISEMLRLGYTVKAYPSASLISPPIGRVVMGAVPDLRTSTPGETVMERDRQIASDFVADLDSLSQGPFFSFLFFDLPHSFELTKEENTPFSPAWSFADYMSLNNSTDPTGFFNLYRNCLHHDDEFIGQVLDALRQKGLMDNSIIIITGDHGQEFNENGKNYWGHNGNFSRHQIGVPLLVHLPGSAPQTYSHRTTHYDLAPTILSRLGVTNPPDDYSAGHLLTDIASRNWHFVGSYLNHAFIVDHDVILEKKADGSMEVNDSAMNLLPDYRIDVGQFRKANERLNRFFK